MQVRTMAWWLGVLVTLVCVVGCDGGKTGPGKDGNQPVSKAAGFSFKSPTLIVTPGGNPSSMVAEVTITNKTDQAITLAYISVSGEVVARGALIVSPDNRIQPGESDWQKIGIGVSAGKGNGVTAVLVAVVLEDGTVYGDGEVVAAASPAGQAAKLTPENIEAAPYETLLAQSPEVIARLSPEALAIFDRRITAEAPPPPPPYTLIACDVALWGPGDVELVRAEFGAGEIMVDVTDALRERLVPVPTGKPLVVRSSLFGIEDPARGVYKSLTMTLVIAGEEYQWKGEEPAEIVLGAPGQREGIVGTLSEPIELEGMRVLAAWYGAQDGWADAMPRLRTVRKDGRIEDRVGNGLGDPMPNVIKAVRVYFEREGERFIAEFPWGETVVLPLEE